MSGGKYNAEWQKKYIAEHPGWQSAKNYKSMKKKVAAEYDLTPDELDKALTAAKKRKAKKAEST